MMVVMSNDHSAVMRVIVVRESTGFFLRFVLITFQFDLCRNLTTTTTFDLSGFHFNLYAFIVTYHTTVLIMFPMRFSFISFMSSFFHFIN